MTSAQGQPQGTQGGRRMMAEASVMGAGLVARTRLLAEDDALYSHSSGSSRVRKAGDDARETLVFLIAFEQVVGEVGGALIETDTDSLDDAINEAVESGRLSRAMNSLLARFPAKDAPAEAPAAVEPPSALPPAVQADMVQAMKYTTIAVRSAGWREDLGQMRAQPETPTGYLFALPSAVARLVWNGERGVAAALGFLCGVTRGADARTVGHLAKTWREGAYALACLAASVKGSTIPFDNVPAEDRLDLCALGENYRTAEQALDDCAAE